MKKFFRYATFAALPLALLLPLARRTPPRTRASRASRPTRF